MLSILKSALIQITHVHPDNAHRIRSDLDLENLVIDNFPIEVAKTVFGHAYFEQPQPPISLKRKCSRSRSPIKRAESAPTPDTIILAPPAKLLKASTTLRGHGASVLKATPERQLLPSVKLETIDTACTITPGGNQFSPLKRDPDAQSPRSPLAVLKDTNSIPTALFSPPRIPSIRGRGKSRGRGAPTGIVHKPRNPPPLVYFDRRLRSVDGSTPKMTIVLRYDLPLQGLQDFLKWVKRSVENLRIDHLDRWLINFHDWARVEQMKEVCITMDVPVMVRYCDSILDGWKAQLEKNRNERMSIQSLLT